MRKHHKYVRQELIRLEGIGDKVRDKHAHADPELKRIIDGQIFSPTFFSHFSRRKESEEALGLGLDTVQRIVKNHGGSIHVNSKPGDTRFQVLLPMAAAQTYCGGLQTIIYGVHAFVALPIGGKEQIC